jgi:hypothetical protein
MIAPSASIKVLMVEEARKALDWTGEYIYDVIRIRLEELVEQGTITKEECAWAKRHLDYSIRVWLTGWADGDG